MLEAKLVRICIATAICSDPRWRLGHFFEAYLVALDTVITTCPAKLAQRVHDSTPSPQAGCLAADVFEANPDAAGPWTGAAVDAMGDRRRDDDRRWPRAWLFQVFSDAYI